MVRKLAAAGDAVRRRQRLASLSEAAWQALALLAVCRQLSSTQLRRMLGDAAISAVRELKSAQLVMRFSYRSKSDDPKLAIFALTSLGSAAARKLVGDAIGSRRGQADELSTLFLAHHLAIQDIYLDLREAIRDGTLISLDWQSGPAASVRYRSLAEPTGKGRVTPDARLEAVRPDRLRVYVCLEMDMGTMGRSAISSKLARYREWLADRRTPFSPGTRIPDPQVWFVADNEGRQAWLLEQLRQSGVPGSTMSRRNVLDRVLSTSYDESRADGQKFR